MKKLLSIFHLLMLSFGLLAQVTPYVKPYDIASQLPPILIDRTPKQTKASIIDTQFVVVYDTVKVVQKEELLGQKLVSRRWYKYVQWNVKQEYVHGVRYFTHYLISTNSITFGVSFMNKENDDFNEYINRIEKL